MSSNPIRSLLVASILCLTGIAAAEHFEMTYVIAGNAVGKETVETQTDGSFVSTASLAISGITIESKLTGKIVDTALVEFEFHETRPQLDLTIKASGNKISATVNGKNQDPIPFKAPKVYFANMHPWLSSSIRNGYDFAKGGAQDIDLFILDGGSVTKTNVTYLRTRPVEAAGKKAAVQVFSLRFLSMVEMTVSLIEGGPTVLWEIPAQYTKVVATGYESLSVDPTTLFKELSQPTYTPKVDKAVPMRTRDGVTLVADFIRPDTAEKVPAILVRTPYGRGSAAIEGEWWAKRGYAYVVQDVRGRFDSEGNFDPFMHERKDGYDTLDWLSKQPWCDGKIGMIGGSYLGYVQWCAAVTGHPALKCIVPQVSPPDMFFNIPYDHGVFFLFGAIWWANVVKDKSSIDVALTGMQNSDKITTLPLGKVDDAVFGKSIPFYDNWLKKTKWSDFGSANFLMEMKNVRIPALHISGWWDGDGIGTKMNWARMRELGRKNQWLVYGPWTHFFNSSTKLGDMDYGPDAVIDLQSIYLRWFDTWLKGKNVGIDRIPRAQIFVMGANDWRKYSDWPPAGAKKTTYYFNSSKSANGKGSAGKLTASKAPRGQKPDTYIYDPSKGKVTGKEADVTQATTKVTLDPKDKDILIYKSDPMKKSLEIGGPITVELYFSTNVKSTDFFATLADVDERGVYRAIGHGGMINAQYLSGWNSPKLLKPGKNYKVTLDLWDTAHRFAPGHRIAVFVTSSGFPAYARNLNTGEPYATGSRMLKAKQTIYHDASRPSAVTFMELPPKK